MQSLQIRVVTSTKDRRMTSESESETEDKSTIEKMEDGRKKNGGWRMEA